MKTKTTLSIIAAVSVIANYATAGEFACSTNDVGTIRLDKCTSFAEQTKTVVVPDYVTLIGDYAFDNQTNLACVYLPDSVTAIGEGAFEGCSNLECVRMSPNIATIGRFAFEGCSRLSHIYVPNDAARRQYISYNWWAMSGDVKPWVRYTRSGDALTLIFEGTLEASDDLQNWVEIESPGLYTHKKDTKFFRTKKEEN